MRSRVAIAVYFWFAANLIRRALLLSLLVFPILAIAKLAQVYGIIGAHTFRVLSFTAAAGGIAFAIFRFADFGAACHRIDSSCSTHELILSAFFGNKSSRFYSALLKRASAATKQIVVAAGKALVLPALFVSGVFLVAGEVGNSKFTPTERARDRVLKDAEDVEAAIEKSGMADKLAGGIRAARLSGDRQKLWHELVQLSAKIESMRGAGEISAQNYSDLKAAIGRAAGALAGKSELSGIFTSSLVVRKQMAAEPARSVPAKPAILEVKSEFVPYKDARTTGAISRYFEEVQK